VSAYKIAIDLTMDTIGNRAKAYRNLVVTVVLTGFFIIAWAIVARAISPFSGFILLFPLCSFYFHMDNRLLNRWRSILLADWVAANIEFRYFREAINANPMLPKETLQGMLETLPAMGDNVTDQGIPSATREAIAVFVSFIHACRADAIAFRTMGYATAGCSLVVAATLHNWRPLLGVIALVPIPLIRKCVKAYRQRKAGKKIVNAHEKPGFDSGKYLEVLSQFHRNPDEQIDIMEMNTGKAK
jgi:hypothetical protein